MMCKDCKDAGQLLSGGYTVAAKALHRLCKRKGCPCQHKLETVLNDSQTTGHPS